MTVAAVPAVAGGTAAGAGAAAGGTAGAATGTGGAAAGGAGAASGGARAAAAGAGAGAASTSSSSSSSRRKKAGSWFRDAAADRASSQRDAYEAERGRRTAGWDRKFGRTAAGVTSAGPGFILAVLGWTWIVLPFLKDGPDGVKHMIKAKFTNKAPDGSYLP